MEPAREIQPFLHFPSPQSLPRRFDLRTNHEESNFYFNLFGLTSQILYDANPFCDSYFILFQGAVGLLQTQEERRNRTYSVLLKEERAKFRKTLPATDPRNPLITHVHMCFQAQQIVNKEAGYHTRVKLYEKEGEQGFKKLRSFCYLLEGEDPREQSKVWQLFESVKRDQMEEDSEPIPPGETEKEKGKRLKREAEKREKREVASRQLQQVDYNNLRQVFIRKLKSRFAVENRIEKEMGLLPDFNQPVLIDAKLIGEISCLVFKILGEATQADLKDKAELLIACRISQIQFSLEMIQLVFLFMAKGGRRRSSHILAPEMILSELEKWFKAFKESDRASPPVASEKGGIVRNITSFFLGKSNDKIVGEVFTKPHFTRRIRDEGGCLFFKEWCDLRTSVVALRNLLSDKARKMSVQLEASPSKEGTPRKIGSFMDGVRREGSSFIKSPRFGFNPQKPSLQQVCSLLGQMGDLLELVITEIEPIETLPVSLVSKLSSEESQCEEKPNEQLLKFYQLIEAFERLVLWHFQADDPHQLVWHNFFEHLAREEEEQNPGIRARIQRAMEKFETDNQALKKSDPDKYQNKYGDRYFEVLIEVAQIYYHPALPILEDNLEVFVGHRNLRRLLYQDPKWKDKTPESFIAYLKRIPLTEVLRVHGGHDSIRSCANDCVATVINMLMNWLHEQRIKLPGAVKPERVETLSAKDLEKLDPFQKDILLINALCDLFLICQTFKGHTLFTDLEKKSQKITPHLTIDQIFEYLKNLSNYPKTTSSAESKGILTKIFVNRVQSESNVSVPLAETRINHSNSIGAANQFKPNNGTQPSTVDQFERNQRPPLSNEVERLGNLTRYLRILLEERNKRNSKKGKNFPKERGEKSSPRKNILEFTLICQNLIARAAKEPLCL